MHFCLFEGPPKETGVFCAHVWLNHVLTLTDACCSCKAAVAAGTKSLMRRCSVLGVGEGGLPGVESDPSNVPVSHWLGGVMATGFPLCTHKSPLILGHLPPCRSRALPWVLDFSIQGSRVLETPLTHPPSAENS